MPKCSDMTKAALRDYLVDLEGHIAQAEEHGDIERALAFAAVNTIIQRHILDVENQEIGHFIDLNQRLDEQRMSAERRAERLSLVLSAVKKPVEEALGHVGAARIQTLPSDDEIVAGHVRDAETLLGVAFHILNDGKLR